MDNSKSKVLTKSGKRMTTIESVKAAPLPQEKTWISVFKAFNPFGPMAESYAKTLAYKIECKRLEVELTRVQEQAGVIKTTIDKTYALKMEELNQRRLALEKFYDTVQQQLEHLHIERMTVLKMAERAADRVLEQGIPMEERQLFKDMASELTSQIPLFGETANKSLKQIVQALPPVAIPTALLPEE